MTPARRKIDREVTTDQIPGSLGIHDQPAYGHDTHAGCEHSAVDERDSLPDLPDFCNPPKGGRTGDGGAHIKPLLIQAAWAAIRVPGRLQARFRRLVRKFGGPGNKGAQKRAITAIAHTLLKIAYSVLKTGKPYADPGADFYTRRESPDARQDYRMRQLQKLNPGCVITITPA